MKRFAIPLALLLSGCTITVNQPLVDVKGDVNIVDPTTSKQVAHRDSVEVPSNIKDNSEIAVDIASESSSVLFDELPLEPKLICDVLSISRELPPFSLPDLPLHTVLRIRITNPVAVEQWGTLTIHLFKQGDFVKEYVKGVKIKAGPNYKTEMKIEWLLDADEASVSIKTDRYF